jgi:hypothetical protein
MRVLVQRVSEAKVSVAGETCGQIAAGLLLLVGVEEVDTPQDIDWLVRKISQLRIFNDDAGGDEPLCAGLWRGCAGRQSVHLVCLYPQGQSTFV